MGQGPSHLTKIPISQPSSGSSTMNLADFGLSTSDTIKVDHQFTLNMGDKWDKPLRKIADSLATTGFHWAESFRIIAMGLSAYFVLSGLARLVEATKSTGDPPTSSKSRSSQSSSSSSRSKSGSSKDKEKSSTSSSKHSKETTSALPEHDEKGNDSL